jgi:hypothetical protein
MGEPCAMETPERYWSGFYWEGFDPEQIGVLLLLSSHYYCYYYYYYYYIKNCMIV